MASIARARWRGLMLAAPCVALLTAGCRGTAPLPEDDPWRERAELEVGESAAFDGGALLIVLAEAGDNHALVTVGRNGSSQGARITTDPEGFVTVPPYRIRLVSSRNGQGATVEVTRLES